MSADAYTRAFRPLSDEPGWLWSLRSEALAHFEQTGFPTNKLEPWKHTKLRPLVQPEWKVEEPGDPARQKTRGIPGLDDVLGGEGHGVLLLDGRVDPARSKIDGLPEGVTVLALRDAVKQRPELVQKYLGHTSDAASRGFVALNLAFFTDGVMVHVAKNVTLDAPITIVVATSDTSKGRANHLRHLIVAERGAKVTVVERYLGADVETLNNVVTEVYPEDGASIHHIKLQQEGSKSEHVSTIDAAIHRDSHFVSHCVAIGGHIARTEVRCRLQEPGAEADLYGLYLGRGEQQLDQLTYVEHAVPNGRSNQVYKGILDDKSSGVFNGMVLVKRDAQHTDATQSNKNLVLSDDANAHTRPQLEIHADDVKCAHGATVGQLDEEALFFLRQRGIPEQAARSMLTSAFANDIVETLDGPVAELVDGIVDGWMS